ncbi:hypothetical protein MHPYR_410005 [uncultured Mycobacterium sp.]|uniref:Uncharacterized protein n=1 Tax=uncultured Mycobacterium sp. TaxID=171292 RepID=A0A1Y5PF06_9MYCO|nr:hypothetical protein MHPYR_410005 [uncultured Mycobacterium sp.]
MSPPTENAGAEDENGLGDQTQAVSHAIHDHPGDQPAAAVDDHTSRNAKWWNDPGYSGGDLVYPDEPEGLPNPLLAKMSKGGLVLASMVKGGLLPPKPQPRRPALPVNVVGAVRARSYALHGLSKELRILAYTAEGSRNDQLNRTGFKVARFVRDGLLSYDEVVGPLRDTAAATGLSDREIEATIRSAFSGADAKDLHTEIPDNKNDLPSAYQIGGDEQ